MNSLFEENNPCESRKFIYNDNIISTKTIYFDILKAEYSNNLISIRSQVEQAHQNDILFSFL